MTFGVLHERPSAALDERLEQPRVFLQNRVEVTPTQSMEFVGFNEAQKSWVQGALTSMGMPLGNIKRVIYEEPSASKSIATVAEYRSGTGEMVFYPSFFKSGTGTVQSKRAMMSVAVHEVAHATDPLLHDGRIDGAAANEEQLQAREDLVDLISEIDLQSKITGKYLDGASGYHSRLRALLDEAVNLQRMGKATNRDVLSAIVTLHFEVYAIATQLSLMAHAQLKKVEDEQRAFFANEHNASAIFNGDDGEPHEFKEFTNELDRLLSILLGFGSINKLKIQRQKISAFIESAPELSFEPPQPVAPVRK